MHGRRRGPTAAGGQARRAPAVIGLGLALVVVTLSAPPAIAQSADRIPIAQFTPLPANPSPSPEAAALRDQLLGPDHDDPSKVTLHWFGVASFIVTIGNHLLLFDAWEIVGLHADYVPIGREELAALEPEAILIGHGHFDHAADAGYVAGRSGAVVVGSDEICSVAKDDAAAEGLADQFVCAITGTASTPAPGTAAELKLFEDLPPITILQHIHSAATPPSSDNKLDPQLPVFDPIPYFEHLNTDPEELARFAASLQDPQGGTWLYHLRIGDFSLLIGDSSGPIFESEPVRAALDAFPTCVDVMANAILGFDQPVSGLQDPALYVQHTHPKVFIPSHADAWAPVISAGQAQYEALFEREMAALEHPPELLWIVDPDDYLREISFDVADERWVAPMPGSSCAASAEQPTPVPAPTDDADQDDGAATPSTGGGVGGSSLLVLALAAVGLAARRSFRTG